LNLMTLSRLTAVSRTFATVAIAAFIPLAASAARAGREPERSTAGQAAVPQAAPAQPAPADSPLVAAAKTKRAAGKKSQVITNETLRHTGGHITTTSAQAPLPSAKQPAAQTAETARKDKRAAAPDHASADRARQERDEKTLATARNAARLEGDGTDGGGEVEDPARLEGAMQKMQASEPQKAKPPR
jgi:hypothetical protein